MSSYQLANTGIHNTTKRWHICLDPYRDQQTRHRGLGTKVLGGKDRLDLLQKHRGGGGAGKGVLGGERYKVLLLLLGQGRGAR